MGSTKMITLRQLSTKDSELFGGGVNLLNRTQGSDLFPEKYLFERVNDPNSYVVAAFEGESLCGIGVAHKITSFDYYLPFDPNISREFSGKTIGSFSTLALCEEMQGLGIGQSLSKLRLEWLKNEGVPSILGVSWVSGLTNTSDRVFEKMGFKKIARLENFYRESSIKEPFDCPGCRQAPCKCAAVLYRFDF